MLLLQANDFERLQHSHGPRTSLIVGAHQTEWTLIFEQRLAVPLIRDHDFFVAEGGVNFA